MKVDYEGAADEAWENYCAAMREMGRESEIVSLYKPPPDAPWGEDDDEPPPVDMGERAAHDAMADAPGFDADLYWHVPTDEEETP